MSQFPRLQDLRLRDVVRIQRQLLDVRCDRRTAELAEGLGDLAIDVGDHLSVVSGDLLGRRADLHGRDRHDLAVDAPGITRAMTVPCSRAAISAGENFATCRRNRSTSWATVAASGAGRQQAECDAEDHSKTHRCHGNPNFP